MHFLELTGSSGSGSIRATWAFFYMQHFFFFFIFYYNNNCIVLEGGHMGTALI